jgi:hypothetical protein
MIIEQTTSAATIPLLFAYFLQTLGRTNCLQGFVSTNCLAQMSEKLPQENGDAGQPLQ